MKYCLYDTETGAAWLANRGAFGFSGTTRAGITVALEHYGFKSTYYTPEHSGGATWKKAMDQES